VFLRRNLITILLSVEVMLNAVNLTFVAVDRYLDSVDGQIIVFFVITSRRRKRPSDSPSSSRCSATRTRSIRSLHDPEVVSRVLLLIPLIPFLGFLVNATIGRRWSKGCPAASRPARCGRVRSSPRCRLADAAAGRRSTASARSSRWSYTWLRGHARFRFVPARPAVVADDSRRSPASAR
jgi:hypothetical protein